jgi:prepilin-type N-terminal cleavage/methylation domain-containing protein
LYNEYVYPLVQKNQFTIRESTVKNSKQQAGFTLVELAIVLVIIGLIVGGVLVGQDLIKAATIRSTISDMEKYNAAATTFRGKYNGLPGDIISTKATEFGFLTGTGRDGSAGKGDGNGLIEGCASAATALGCETASFWVDLGTAALIPSRPSSYSPASTTTIATQNVTALAGSYLPKTKLRDNAIVAIFPHNGRNFFAIGAISTGASGATLIATGASGSVSPLEARGMDEKLDDGLPTSGTVQAIKTDLVTADTGGAAATNVCVSTDTTPASYLSTTDAYLNAPTCGLSVRASF